MKKIVYLVGIGVFSLVFSACGGEEKNDGVDNTDTVDQVVEDTTDMSMVEEYSTVLPSPVAVAEIFANSGIEYDKSLPNALENATKYSTSYQKALNFGVYTSDLAFCIVSEKNKEASSYLAAVRTLGNEIGLNSVFDNETYLKRFDANLDNQDSLTDLMIEIKSRVDEYHEQNAELEKTVIYFAGAWIEGMYLGAIKSDKNEKAGKAMAAQFYMLDDILKGMKKVQESSSDYDGLIKDLEQLKTDYMALETVKAAGEDMMYDVTLKTEEVKLLADKIIKMRTAIIKV